jgi:hypothetical protein
VVVKVDGVVFLHGGLIFEVAVFGCEAVNGIVRWEITDDIDKTLKDLFATLAVGENGLLWYCGLAKEDEAVLLFLVERVLQSLGVWVVVVGYSVMGDGCIKARFGGRVIGIDVGMGEGYGGSLAALEIGPDGLFALYPRAAGRSLRPAAAAARLLRPATPGLDIRLLAHARGSRSALRGAGVGRPGAVAVRGLIIAPRWGTFARPGAPHGRTS